MKWKSIWGNDLGSHLWKKNWSRMGQQPEAGNQRSFLSRGGSTDSLIIKWYLERVNQPLLPNRYQSKRDGRKLLVLADCVLWVDREQTVLLLKWSQEKTDIKVIRDSRKSYTFILILTQPMERSAIFLQGRKLAFWERLDNRDFAQTCSLESWGMGCLQVVFWIRHEHRLNQCLGVISCFPAWSPVA